MTPKQNYWVRDACSKEFESSSVKTPEFMEFIRVARNWFKVFSTKNGWTNLDFHVGHFEFSGFFTDPRGQIWYFSSGDVRFKIMNAMLIRTAKSYKDYTGGQNQFVKYSEGNEFGAELLSVLHHNN